MTDTLEIDRLLGIGGARGEPLVNEEYEKLLHWTRCESLAPEILPYQSSLVANLTEKLKNQTVRC